MELGGPRCRIKAAILAVFVAAMGFIPSAMQEGLAIGACEADIQREMDELLDLLENAQS